MTTPTAIFAVFLGALGAVPAAAAPKITAYQGIVQVRAAGTSGWALIREAATPLAPGDTVRTGTRASATLTFDDRSRIELGANGSFTLEDAVPAKSGIHLLLGTIRVKVEKFAARKFTVRTPVAVCSVRGTEFQVDVQAGGRTTVDLYQGLLAVEDPRGQQILLQPNQRIEVDAGGMSQPGLIPNQGQIQRSQFHSVMRREMSLDMSKEEVQAAAAREIKLAEYQQGKSLIDVFGQRVRLEEYIVRPAPNQFKLVVLNEREARFDYFYYLGTFNKDLPKDLSTALRQLPGGVGSAPDYFMTGFETGRSNTKDSMIERALEGHLVDVNNNATASDDVKFFYDSVTDSYVDVTGKSVYQTIFDKYGFYINGGLKYGWTGNNAQSYSDTTASSVADPITGAALAAALPARSVSVTFPDAGSIHQVIYESYSDGTFTQWDNYILDDQGKVATISDFQGIRSGAAYKEKILQFNFEQVVTASEFGGRKIDLVVEPRIFIQAGLVQ